MPRSRNSIFSQNFEEMHLLGSAEQVSSLDHRANEQGSGRVTEVDDHPEAPAPSAQVAWPAKEHLGQEHVDFGEEGRTGEDNQHKAY